MPEMLALPRKVVVALADAITNGKGGNFVIHLRRDHPRSEVMGYTFEVKESLYDVDRTETIALA